MNPKGIGRFLTVSYFHLFVVLASILLHCLITTVVMMMMMILPFKQEGSDHRWEAQCLQTTTTKKRELGEGENVVLFQSFPELVARDVDLNKNLETSDFCITQPLCLEEKKRKKKRFNTKSRV